mmetsp:Transcript_12143/g.18356  ORF Transcript_12143/g.18356 Transcript_12143/m.18356 type:complete len:83 (+) Transcript_12143:1517-1765(+)
MENRVIHSDGGLKSEPVKKTDFYTGYGDLGKVCYMRYFTFDPQAKKTVDYAEAIKNRCHYGKRKKCYCSLYKDAPNYDEWSL